MLTTVEDNMEEVASTTPVEKTTNNLKETEATENDQNEYTYSYEQDPSLKTLMNNFDNSILIDSFQNQCLQFDTERLLNVNPTFFYNDDVFNPENYEITSKELFERLVQNRTAFMNILLIDLSIYSNFSICGAQVFPNLKQTCIKLKDVTDFIEIKKELYNACYLVFEDQWDRKDSSTIIVFDDDGKSPYARAFTEICIEGQWGREALMLKDGILSFMKEYPILCVSVDYNEDDEYDDDDDDDYYYDEGLYKTDDTNNTLNESYTSTIEMVDINKDNFNYINNESIDNNQDINTIFTDSTQTINNMGYTTTDTTNSTMNDVDMVNATSYQPNDMTVDANQTISNPPNDISISIGNETPSNEVPNTSDMTDVTTSDDPNQEYEQIDKKRKIDKSDQQMKKEESTETSTKNETDLNVMDYQTTEEEEKIPQNPEVNEEVTTEMDHAQPMATDETMETNTNQEGEIQNIPTYDNQTYMQNMKENTLNTFTPSFNETEPVNSTDSQFIDTNTYPEMGTEAQTETGTMTEEVTDSMACYDPRQMASISMDYNSNKLFKNNQTEEIIKLRKFQRYLIHNVWYAMDNSNDVPLMVCPPFLYLGSLYTSQEHHLINYNIKHIIRLGTDFNITYTDPSRFNFYNFDIFDLPKEPIKELFKRANDIIEQARLNHENVLVHCHAGVSRSSTIILAYLMRYKGMSLYDAWCSTFKIRPIIRPNEGFAIALQEYEKMLFGYKEPTMPVVGMSNSYLFSIEYFDFVSRLEEMHKLDPTVPVFRPEKTYDDLVREAEDEAKMEEEEALKKEEYEGKKTENKPSSVIPQNSESEVKEDEPMNISEQKESETEKQPEPEAIELSNLTTTKTQQTQEEIKDEVKKEEEMKVEEGEKEEIEVEMKKEEDMKVEEEVKEEKNDEQVMEKNKDVDVDNSENSLTETVVNPMNGSSIKSKNEFELDKTSELKTREE